MVKPYSQLENIMRPHKSSLAGFLGANESLKGILLEKDNNTVISVGLTHKDLVLPLIMALNTYRATKEGEERAFIFMGRKSNVTGTTWMGRQESPFGEEYGSSDVVITNSLGSSLRFPELLTYLIPYGFYEGEGTSYRCSPQEIIEFFDLKKID